MEEVELKYVPESGLEPHKPTDFIDSKVTCFVCQINIHHNNDDNLPQDETTQNVSLFRICSYLKINLQDIISTHPNNVTFQKLSKLQVNVCQECKSIVENFTNLLEQLELFQMKVEHTLGQFTRILRNSTVDKNISKNLRHEIFKKCNQKLTTVLPKVSVGDILDKKNTVTTKPKIKISSSSTLPGCSTEIPLPSSPPSKKKAQPNKWKCNYCPSSYVQKTNLETHCRNIHGEKVEYICPRCDAKFDRRLSYSQHKNFDCPHLPPKISKNDPGPGLRTCTLCHPSKPIQVKNWGCHNTRFHIESYFTSSRLPELSPENFKIYCEQVFRILQNSAKTSRNSVNVIMRECRYCSNTFQSQFLLRCHLVNGHRKIMTKMITATQNNLSLEQIIKGAILPKISISDEDTDERVPTALPGQDASGKNKFVCTLCQPNRKIWSALKSQHNASFHAEMIFSAVRNEGVSEQDFKKYCEYLFKAEIESFKIVVNNENKYRKLIIECGHCRETCVDKKSIKSHLIRIHKNILKEKLIILQNTVRPSEILEKLETGFSSQKSEIGESAGDQNEIVEKMEVVEENFEQSAVFVTKVDIPTFQQSGVNYAEIGDNDEPRYDEEYIAENDNLEDVEIKIVPDLDPLEI